VKSTNYAAPRYAVLYTDIIYVKVYTETNHIWNQNTITNIISVSLVSNVNVYELDGHDMSSAKDMILSIRRLSRTGSGTHAAHIERNWRWLLWRCRDQSESRSTDLHPESRKRSCPFHTSLWQSAEESASPLLPSTHHYDRALKSQLHLFSHRHLTMTEHWRDSFTCSSIYTSLC
jgi:hypothetical protein